MARRKSPENETEDQRIERQHLEAVANVANRSEKTSWNRKMNNMVSLLATLRPIEEKILELIAEKQPILDQVAELRMTMVNECIHPYEYLLHEGDHVKCKFCDKNVSLPK